MTAYKLEITLEPDEIDQDEIEIIQLQEHIITNLLKRVDRAEARTTAVESASEIFRQERNKSLVDITAANNEVSRLKERNIELARCNHDLNEQLKSKQGIDEKEVNRLLEEALLRQHHDLHNGFNIERARFEVVKAELEQKQADLEQEIAERKATNVELSEKVGKLTARANESHTLALDMKKALDNCNQIIADQKTYTDMTERGFEILNNTLNDHVHYNAALVRKLEHVKTDNVYLALLKDYQELISVFERGTWRVNVMTKAWSIPSQYKPFERKTPIHKGYLMFCALDVGTGTGVMLYLDENKQIQFATDNHGFPEEYLEDLHPALVAASVEEINEAVDRSTNRARNIAHAASNLDESWSEAVNFAELARKIANAVDYEHIKTMNDALEQVGRLLPPNRRAIDTINKRFNANLNFADYAELDPLMTGRLPKSMRRNESKQPDGQKVGRNKSKRKKKK